MLWAQLSFWVAFLLEIEGHSEPASWGFNLSQGSRTSLCYRGQDQEVGWLGVGPCTNKTLLRTPALHCWLTGAERQ